MANDDDTTDETQGTQEESSETRSASSDPDPQPEDFAETFKTAAQKVLEERFGMEQKADGTVDFTKIDSEKVKTNAQALITGLMSQLAGITPAENTTPKSEAPVPATTDDNVIDLEAARRARGPREPSDLEQRLSENLKATFNAYIQDNLVPSDSEGKVQLNVDGEMLRDHGPQMLTALFGAFTNSLFPEGGVQVDLGGRDTSPDQCDETTESAETVTRDEAGEAHASENKGEVDVKLNVDVAGIFRGLIDSVKPKT